MSVVASFVREEGIAFLRFPFWWYGRGFAAVLVWMREDLRREWSRLGIRLWLRSWLLPMYGVSDLAGRLISLLMRTVTIAVRLLWWFLHALVFALGAAAWLVWPPLALSLLFAPLLW